jgi:amino acid permease
MKYMEININCFHRHVYIVLVQMLVHLFTCHTTQALIKCPLFLITFDLIYPTFIFYLYYVFFKKLGKWE